MFDFELDDGQLELRAAARRVFEAAGGLALARQLFELGGGFSRELWQTMIDLDRVGLAVPEAHGGSGGGVLDLYAVCLETGRAVVSSPLIPSSVVAAKVLAGAADASPLVADLLSRLAAGAAIVAPALLEPSGVWDERGVETRLERGDRTPTVTGTKVVVPFADVAERLLVPVRDGDGVSLVLVDPAAAGVSVTPVDNLASLPLFSVVMEGVEIDGLVGPKGAGWSLLAPALAGGAVLRAAETAGAGERLLELVVEYAQDRKQFGRAIGSYQAVQYLCTDIGIESHLTGLLARRAAWLIDTGRPSERGVAAAKLYASRAAAHMAHQAHEVFAGVGFMMEHDLHLFTRHAKHWEHDLGDVRHHSDELVEALQNELGNLRP
jgi:alkylation response protein AidB-like acyl-CoA dehydrogenase